MPYEPAFRWEDEDVIAPCGYDRRHGKEPGEVEPVLRDEVGVDEIGVYVPCQFFYRTMARDERKVEVGPPRRKNVFGHIWHGDTGRVVGCQVHVVPFLREILGPALGMDAARVGDEEEDQRNRLSYSENHKFIS